MAITKNFISAGQTIIPANADFQSDKIDISLNYTWVISPIATGIVGGPPTYSIEVSVDGGVKWVTYPGASGLAIATDFTDNDLAYTSMRINYLKGSTTAGTVEFPLILKQK